uniref:Legume lectin domain-containing protein n=1 Tax=Oryza brachyantha TaxID=4533 RepID=J3MIE1_ORYBR
MAMPAINHIFAIELDTVLNNDMLDIDDNHVGIDINDLRSTDSYTAGYYDNKNGVNQNGLGPIKVD